MEAFLKSKGIRGVSINSKDEILLLAYADDIVILSESSAMLKRILREIKKYCDINGLTVNIDKTHIIVFSKGGYTYVNLKFYFGNEIIRVVNNYVYLGITSVSSALLECSTKNIVRKANIAVASTLKLITNTKLKIWKKIQLLYESLVSSVILYSSPVWSINYLNLLEKVQNQFFKVILLLPKCTPDYAVRLEIKRDRLAVNIFQLVLNWISKIISMNNSRYPKICLKKLIEIDKRKDCILKYNWISLINKIFLKPINATDIWNAEEQIIDAISNGNLIQKYADYLREMDEKDFCNSTSLLIQSRILYPKNESSYLNINFNLELKKFLAQLKLLNCYCTRLISGNCVYVLKNDCVCENFLAHKVNIFHWIENCKSLDYMRQLLRLNISFPTNDLNFKYYYNSPSPEELNKLKIFILHILEKSPFQKFVIKHNS